jgi:hypothetical protein
MITGDGLDPYGRSGDPEIASLLAVRRHRELVALQVGHDPAGDRGKAGDPSEPGQAERVDPDRRALSAVGDREPRGIGGSGHNGGPVEFLAFDRPRRWNPVGHGAGGRGLNLDVVSTVNRHQEWRRPGGVRRVRHATPWQHPVLLVHGHAHGGDGQHGDHRAGAPGCPATSETIAAHVSRSARLAPLNAPFLTIFRAAQNAARAKERRRYALAR